MQNLVNTSAAQAIEVPGAGLTMVNFWQAGNTGMITASGPASVVVLVADQHLTVAVSDPSRSQDTITITVLHLGKPHMFDAHVGGTAGGTVSTTFSLSP